MNAMVFDTLKLAKRQEEAGFTTAQAQGAAAAIADTFREDLATQRNVKESEAALRHDLKESETALRADMQALRAELQTFRAEWKADLRDLEHRMTIRLVTMLAAAIVLVGAMVKLL
jgi:hypothetical protein